MNCKLSTARQQTGESISKWIQLAFAQVDRCNQEIPIQIAQWETVQRSINIYIAFWRARTVKLVHLMRRKGRKEGYGKDENQEPMRKTLTNRYRKSSTKLQDGWRPTTARPTLGASEGLRSSISPRNFLGKMYCTLHRKVNGPLGNTGPRMFTTTLALVAQSGRATLITIAKNILAESWLRSNILLSKPRTDNKSLKEKMHAGEEKLSRSKICGIFRLSKVREEKIRATTKLHRKRYFHINLLLFIKSRAKRCFYLWASMKSSFSCSFFTCTL